MAHRGGVIHYSLNTFTEDIEDKGIFKWIANHWSDVKKSHNCTMEEVHKRGT